MNRSPVDQERNRLHQLPEWKGTASGPPEKPLPPGQVRSGIDEALRELAFRASYRSRLLYNPFARRT